MGASVGRTDIVLARKNSSRLKKKGFWGLGILVFMTLLFIILAFTIGKETFHLDDLSNTQIPDPFLAWRLPAGLVSFLIIWSLGYFIRILYFKYYKIIPEDQKSIINSRENFDLIHFKNSYSNHTLKMIDGMPRKITHILTTLFGLFYISIILETRVSATIQFSLAMQTINIIISIITYSMNNALAQIIYGPSSRSRDGMLGRTNLLIVRCTSLCAYISIAIITAHYQSEISGPKDRSLVLLLIMVPTAIGDALGEIIGSVWGKHTYQVKGLGEINQKSWEGTLAVFLGSVIPLIGVFALEKVLNWNTLACIGIIGLISTILEAIAFRSTDNYLLPVTNSLLVLGMIKLNLLNSIIE